MDTINLSKEIQDDFILALNKNNIKNWIEDNNHVLQTISEKLRHVKIILRDSKRKKLYEFICNSFLKLFEALWKPEVLKSKSVLRNVILKSDWKEFKSKYKFYFDTIIKFAREQSLMDIRIEGKNQIWYFSFEQAENDNYNNSKNWTIVSQQLSDNQKNSRHNETFGFDPSLRTGNSIQSNKMSRSAVENPPTRLSQKTRNSVDEYCEQFDKIMDEKALKTPLAKRIPTNTGKVNRNGSEISNTSSNFTFRRNQLDSSFQRKLNEQNMKFADEMTKMKEKRNRLNEEAEEEMRKFRIESAMRIQMLLNCIHLKLRWEEQEQEWNDWLKCARDPVIKVKNEFLEFDRIRRYDDEDEIRSEVLNLHKYVQMAYDKLVHAFGTLTMLSDQYEDKIFLKVIQRSISNVATKICYLLDELEEFQNNEQFYSSISQLEANIDSMEIPSTSKLRSICKTISSTDYQIINPPKQPKPHCVITEV